MRIAFIVITFVAYWNVFAQDQALDPAFLRSSGGEVCSSSNNYLNEEIERLRRSSNLSSFLLKSLPFPSQLLVVKRACVQSALSQVSAGIFIEPEKIARGARSKNFENNFIRCGPDKKILKHQESPCQSRDSLLLIHNSFETITGCLKDYVSGSSNPEVQNKWAQFYFKMLTKESGLQNNVMSKMKALGSAQLMPIYIRDFLENSMEEVKTHLAQSAQPICRTLGKEILSDEAIQYFVRKKSPDSYTYNTCALVGAEHNQILRNQLIGFANLKLFRTRARQFAFSGNKQVQMNAEEQLKLELQMVPLAYNLGTGELERVIDKALNTFSKTKPANTARGFMRAVLAHTQSKEAKNYLTNIDTRFSKVVEAAGISSCFNE